MKVLFLTNIPSPYRVNFFNELGKLCDLTVVFECRSSSERDKSWKQFDTTHFSAAFLRGFRRGVANAVCPGILRYLEKGYYDHIIVTNFTSPTGMLAIQWMRMRRIPYWLESDGGFAKSGYGLKERVKKYFIQGAAGYFSTAQEHDRYYLQYGAVPERIHRYPFTSLYRKDILETPVSAEEKAALRKKLGVAEKKMVVSVGRFTYMNGYGKGYDVLLRCAERMDRQIGWYIIGGEPTEEFVRMKDSKNLDYVHFVRFLDKSALEQYYLASDAFVLMTVSDVWGLVVNEAMGYGQPVITTDKCIAGLELVKDDVNGYIVPVGDDGALSERLEKILSDRKLAEQMSCCSLQRIGTYTFENMAKLHIEVLAEEEVPVNG